MRIIAGRYRGRTIRPPKGRTTRPTTDRVRESMFSMLTSAAGSDLGGGPVLDAFAGSGALGLEALSRGAGPVTFVENDGPALGALKENIRALGAEEVTAVVARDAFSLAGRGAGGPYSLILLDPPYTLDPARISGLLEGLASRGAIAEECVVAWEHGSDRRIDWPDGFASVASRRYGLAGVDVARYTRGVAQT